MKRAKATDLPRLKRQKLWIDVTKIAKEEQELLQRTFGLHALTVEDLQNSPIRIKVEEFPEYLFCVFYSISNAKTPAPVEVDFVLGKDFLITNRREEIASLTALKADEQQISELFKKGFDHLFYKILDQAIDDQFPVLEKLNDQIEELEEAVAKRPQREQLSSILTLKRLIVRLRRRAFTQREKLGTLSKERHKYLSEEIRPYLRDVYDHQIRVSDLLDNEREAIGNAFDVYMSAVSNSMNEVMKVLSIIATLALPLGVISGIYGTNFITLPGSQAPYGFWLMIIGMGCLISAMLLFFKRRGWF